MAAGPAPDSTRDPALGTKADSEKTRSPNALLWYQHMYLSTRVRGGVSMDGPCQGRSTHQQEANTTFSGVWHSVYRGPVGEAQDQGTLLSLLLFPGTFRQT